MEELELHALMVPASQGGHGGGAVEAALVMEALGRRLAMDAFAEHCIVAPALLLGIGARDVVCDIAQGRARVALCFDEAGLAGKTRAPSARMAGAHHLIGGHVSMVLGGRDASHLLVCARDDEGPALFLVAASAPGVTRTDYPLIDGRSASDFELDDTEAGAPLARGDAARSVQREAYHLCIFTACAEALGVMREMMDLTIAYVGQRRQFGAPLGSFQAIQHRVADMALAGERAEAMTLRLRLSLQREDAGPIAAAALVIVSETLRFVGQSAVQLHGATGTIDEAPVSHYFRRATVLEGKFGSSAANLRHYSDLFAAR